MPIMVNVIFVRRIAYNAKTKPFASFVKENIKQ